MNYTLRNFDNNYQAVSSLGWVISLLSLILFFVAELDGFLLFIPLGILMILWQLRGKRVHLNTESKTIRKGTQTIQLKEPTRISINQVKMSQRVNSRVSSTQARQTFYKAYLQDGDENHVISSNRKEERDMEKLKAIAKDLGVELTINY